MVAIIMSLRSKIDEELLTSLVEVDYQSNWYWIVMAFILMPFNWLLETYKWFLLVRLNFPARFNTCFKAVMAGMSIAIFTPNRVGEFGGRILLFKKEYRSSLIWSTIIGNYSQTIIIISCGVMGFLLLSSRLSIDLLNYFNLFLGLNCFLILVLLVVYFNAFLFMKVIMKLIPFERVKSILLKSLYPLRKYRRTILAKVLLFSMLRYLIYTFQYFLTLRFFNVNLPTIETIQSISSVYLLKTSIPYPPAMGFLMRGEITVWIFQFFTENLLAVVAASTLIWIINVVVPAVFGYLIIVREDLHKRF